MAESEGFIPIEKKLSELFKEAFDFFLKINDSTEPTNSLEFQLKIKKHIGNFEDATRLVSLGGTFSENEGFEEIPTGDIKYLLLPFFLGQLTLKLNSTDSEARKNLVEVAEVYYKDFLKRCGEYGLTERVEQEDTTAALVRSAQRNPNELEELKQMAVQRNEKLRKFQEKKELEGKINQMKVAVEREDALDDDVLRDFYSNLIKFSVLESEEELKFLDQEKLMLDFRRQQQLGGVGPTDEHAGHPHHSHHHHRHTFRPQKPIIITRDALQKAVYGRGYPSMATMTVEEFYHDRVAEGIFPDPNKKSTVKSRQEMTDDEVAQLDEQEEILIEQEVERDDEVRRARQQAMDEFKDDVRRGDGNRYNRS